MYLIYAYVKKDINKVVYVGQTKDLKNRRYKHEHREPIYQNGKEYNYPLSRGFRKYGVNAYDLIILEDNLTREEIDEREIYWINYYNTYKDPAGYNQTPGGKRGKEYFKFNEETISLAKKLLKEQKPFKEISEITGISIVMLSEINSGTRHRDENEQYPLNYYTHGRKLSLETVDKIINLLLEGELTQQQIAIQLNVKENQVGRINQGTAYKRDNLKYPLRTKVVSGKRKVLNNKELQQLIQDIMNTDISFEKLGIKYGISISTVYSINKGKSRKQENLEYPLRK